MSYFYSTLFIRSLFILLPLTSALDGNVKQNVSLPDVIAGAFSLSQSVPIRLNCMDSQTMANSSFPNWIKVWRLNGSELFDVSRITFVNSNASIQFDSLTKQDEGLYECCYHAYAYEDFICGFTRLIVADINAIPLQSTTINPLLPTNPSPLIMDTSTSDPSSATYEPPLDTNQTSNSTSEEDTEVVAAWNVQMLEDQIMSAMEQNAYFIQIFPVIDKVIDIECKINGNSTTSIRTGNKFPTHIYSDVLIPNFNKTQHQGRYSCEAIPSGNGTMTPIKAEFTVVHSETRNRNSTQLQLEEVLPYLKISTFPGILIVHLFLHWFINL